MNKKILYTPSLIILFFTISVTFLTGQTIRFQSERASPADDLKYLEYFKSYQLGTLATEITSDLLRSKDFFDHLQIEVQGQTFSFDLKAHDLRPAHYKLRAAGENGVLEMPRTPNKTYRGHTLNGNQDVRITADNHFFYALIGQGNDEFYIEPARNIVSSAPVGQFVMYWASDNLKKFKDNSCGVGSSLMHEHHPEEENPEPAINQNRFSVCKTLQIALANDYEMFQEKGSATAVENHNLAVINNVLTNYDDEFNTDLEFDVVEIYVATSNGTDPWTNSTNAEVLLDDFTNWGPNGFDNTHDLGGLWTNRDFDGDIIGVAWIGSVCTNDRYHTVQDFTNNANLLRCLQAHEMGHNFSAFHDAAGSMTIMAPSVSNTNTWSAASLNSINSEIATLNCLGNCAAPLPPVADFEADDTQGCAPFVVHFSDLSANSPTSWLWSFPGGTPSTSVLENPTVTYNSAGVFDVTLTATNAQGSNSITFDNYITVEDDPIADFDYEIDEFTVDFENLSEGATSYLWDFDDGQTSTQTDPSHIYEEDGVYDVKLTATNVCGTDNHTVEIEIITLPIPDFSSDDNEGCDPFEVQFFNFSSNNTLTYLWNFPGGSPPFSTAFEPSVVYEIPGVYDVTLTVENDAGETSLTLYDYITVYAQPNAIFTADADGLEVIFNSAGSVGNTYSWNFGDGGSSNQQNPTHIYNEGGTYTVVLTVTNECGNDAYQTTVNVIAAPVAGFSSNDDEGCVPFVVQFINQSFGTVTSFSWVFQGGSPPTSNLSNPVVTYNNPGVFDVTLTVSNSQGSDVLFENDYITVNALTVSNFDYEVTGMSVLFNNLSSSATSSAWAFGDGIFSDDENPVHVYDAGGTYTVTLISTGICGNDTSTTQVTIESLPVANFSFQQNGNCIPATVQYTNLSTPNATSYKWTFPGGSPSTSTQSNPLVTYNSAGTFDVQLIAFAPAGSDTINMDDIVTVGLDPEASFLISTDSLTVHTENLSTNSNSFEWLFGDGSSSSEIHPSHTYASFGTYTIILISSNECGSDTMSFEIVLGTVPNAAFSFDNHNGCAPFQVQFIDQSQNNPTSWLWTFTGGDPVTSDLQNPVVIYQAPGVYSVTLQVTNGNGTDVVTVNDVIQVANTPDATFEHSVFLGSVVLLNYPGTDYDSLRWDFGDGRTDTSLNPTIEYLVSGQYTITLTVYNACGIDTASVVVDIIVVATNDPFQNTALWRIIPNPFSDYFSIYGEPLEDGLVTIALLDVQGKLISKEDWLHTSGPAVKEFKADHLPAGIILVQIRDGKSSVVLRGVHQE